ncbi:MAG: hypothetical protein WB757_14125 [Candidatus Cybelea sp.]
MIDFRRGRHALGVCATLVILAGCGVTQPPIGAPSAFDSPRKHHGKKRSQTFAFTGSEQTFTVPTGVTRVIITASGASGQGGYGSSGYGALGGLIVATIRVTPRESLAVFVGGEFRNGSYGPGVGGYNRRRFRW